MGFFSKIFSTGIKEIVSPIDAVGNVLDKLFTTDGERLDKQILLERMRQQPAIAQTEINKVEAAHKSVFVAGWRPAIGWVCAIGIAVHFIINPLLSIITGHVIKDLGFNDLLELVFAMLGMGGLRTYEKIKGVARKSG